MYLKEHKGIWVVVVGGVGFLVVVCLGFCFVFFPSLLEGSGRRGLLKRKQI